MTLDEMNRALETLWRLKSTMHYPESEEWFSTEEASKKIQNLLDLPCTVVHERYYVSGHAYVWRWSTSYVWENARDKELFPIIIYVRVK